jgi:3-phosphoshikimate 1-carboxyvinyltransferase
VDASSSSQLVSGLLLAAPRYARGVAVSHVGPPVPSTPHLHMTVDALRRFGAQIQAPGDAGNAGPGGPPDRWQVAPGALTGQDIAVEPDLSTALPFLAAAAVTGGQVTLAGWPAGTTQPGRLLPELFTAFGAVVDVDGDRLSVRGGRLHGADLDLHAYGEAAPVLTALALFADGPSRLRGIAHLRLQETDRLAALAEEFGRLGARITVLDDGLHIDPSPLHAATLDPRADHRLAMAYAVAGLVVPGVRILDVATTGKTIPDFAGRWTALLT